MAGLFVERRVIRLVERLYCPLGVKVTRDTRLFSDLQLSQEQFVDLWRECQIEFDVVIPDVWLAGLATVAGLVETIERLKGPM